MTDRAIVPEPGQVSPAWSHSRRALLGNLARFGASASAIALTQRSAAFASPRAGHAQPLRYQVDSSTMVIADEMVANWKTLDPGFFYEGSPYSAMWLLYEPLYQLPDTENPDLIEPLLAEDLPAFSVDGLSATIPLKPGVTFHQSGREATARDWVFSWNRLKNIGLSGSFLASDYWDSVEALDDYTLQLTLAAPNAALLSVLCAIQLSVTDSEAVMALGGTDAPPSTEEDSPELVANTEAKNAIDQMSVGTGPFVLTKFDSTTEAILERHAGYWGPEQHLERVIFRNVVEVNAQLESVLLGEADIAMAIGVDQLPAIEGDPAFQMLEGPTLNFQYLAMNLRPEWGGPLAQRDVRQALSHAVDYDGIIASMLGGDAERPATPVPLPLAGSREVEDLKYSLDLEAAQRLWDESGVGVATIELLYGSDASGYGGVDLETLATKLQADLERIEGLTIQLAPVPATQRSAAMRAGEFQMTLTTWSPDIGDVDGFASPFFRTDTSIARRVGFSDPEIDALLDQGVAEQDPERRTEIYAEIQRRMIEEAVYIVLHQPIHRKPASAEVTGATTHFQYHLNLRGAAKTG